MKFRWLTKSERALLKRREEQDWHRHFAWKPVPLKKINEYGRILHNPDNIGNTYAFMERVWRERFHEGLRHISEQDYFKMQLKNPQEK